MGSFEGGSRPDQQLPVGPETSAAEWADLHHSMTDLSRLPTDVVLTDALTSIAVLAVHAIPGAEGAGLTLLEQGQPDTIVATATFVSAVDDIQYALGEGPCISAAEEGVTVQSPALGRDSRWPRFGEQVARLGVYSALSLPLITTDSVLGAMNIYARRTNAFSQPSVQLGEMFAVPAAVAVQNAQFLAQAQRAEVFPAPAAVAVQNAQILAQAQRLAAELQRGLDARESIDQAVGILMVRNGVGADEALTTLNAMSVTQQRELRVVAESIVDFTVRRARASRKR